jgi:hypothetical protein
MRTLARHVRSTMPFAIQLLHGQRLGIDTDQIDLFLSQYQPNLIHRRQHFRHWPERPSPHLQRLAS